jgi:hypothetical protein
MVMPMDPNSSDQELKLEYLGEVGKPDEEGNMPPCATFGLGGGIGPRVPTLVR